MAWMEINDAVEDVETTATAAQETETDSKMEHLCKCMCEIKETLLRIESKMCEPKTEESPTEVIAYNERRWKD